MRLKSVIHSLAGLALVAGVAAAQSKPTLAVLPLTNSALGKANDELQPLSKGLADMLITSLASNPNVRVVERASYGTEISGACGMLAGKK